MPGRIIPVALIALCAVMPAFAQTSEEAQRERAAIEQAIDAVTLPDKPTREQCEKYLAQLRELSAQRCWDTSNYGEVTKLKAVPIEHLDLLATEIINESQLGYYANYLLSQIDPETYRESVIAHLQQRPNNIWFVAQNGWFKLAKGTILERLNDADAKTSPAWFQAFTEVAQPEHYRKLHEIAIESPHIATFIALLETLPDYDLSQTIRVAWENMKQESGSFANLPREASIAFSFYAAQTGEIEALAMLIDQLDGIETTRNGIDNDRLRVNRCIDFRGSNKEILVWFASNRDKLLFDHHRKRFVVPDQF